MTQNILIIDDDELAVLVRKMVLEDAGYNVFSAVNTSDALRIFATHNFDLVIADHMLLPRSDRSLAAELRHLSPTLPVLLLSGGTALPADEVTPPYYFLHKLEGPTEMIAKVRSAMAAHA